MIDSAEIKRQMKSVFGNHDPWEFVDKVYCKLDGGYRIEVSFVPPGDMLHPSNQCDPLRYRAGGYKSIGLPDDFIDAVIYGHSAYKTYALGEWGGARPGKMVPTPKQVIFSGPKTIVIWPDGTKTIVSLSEGEEYDEYTAFCAAFVKKAFGGTHRAKKFLESIKSCPKPKAEKKKAKEQEQVEESCGTYETDKGPCEGERR